MGIIVGLVVVAFCGHTLYKSLDQSADVIFGCALLLALAVGLVFRPQ